MPKLRAASATMENSVVIEPCFIGENVKIVNSIVGPHVSLGKGTIVENSVIRNSIVQTNAKVISANIVNSMVGNHAEIRTKALVGVWL